MRLFMLIALIAGAGYCAAASASWTGLGTDPADWSDTGNWSATPPPGPGDIATFNAVTANVSTGLPSSLGGINVSGGGALRLGGAGQLVLTGAVDVQGVSSVFGIEEATSATDPLFQLTLNGTLTTGVSASLEYGHGEWRFTGPGATLAEGSTLLPASADSAPVIWLMTSGTFNLSVNGPGGAKFWADRILAGVNVVQDGVIELAGNLVFEGTASWSVNAGGSADGIEVVKVTMYLDGEPAFTDNTPNVPPDEALVEVTNIVVANGNVALPNIFMPEQTGFVANGPGEEDDESEALVLLIRHAQDNSTGLATLADVTIEADSNSATLGADDRNNNILLIGTNSLTPTTLNGVVTLAATSSGSSADSPPALILDADPTRAFADPPIMNVGSVTLSPGGGTSTGAFVVARGEVQLDGTLTIGDSAFAFIDADLTFATGANIDVASGGLLQVVDSLLTTASPTDTYSITSALGSIVFFQGSEFTAAGSNAVTLTLGAATLFINQSRFSNYDPAGLELIAGTELSVFYENEFSNGVSGGAHITLNGLAMDAAGIEIYFDDSVAPLASGAGSGLFVAGTADGGGGETMAFANTSDEFGLAPFGLTASAAQIDSGTNISFVADINAARFTEAASQRASIRPNTTANQTVLQFDVDAISTGGTDTVIDDINVNFEALEGTLTLGAIQSVTLYIDANSDDSYDAGEEIAAGTLDQPLSTTSSIVFDLQALGAVQTIVAGAQPLRWGVAITFSQEGMSGYLRTRVDFGDVTVTPSHAVLGLPVEHDVRLTIIKRNEKTKKESGCSVNRDGPAPLALLVLLAVLASIQPVRRRFATR